jgi:hypothetical protein
MSEEEIVEMVKELKEGEKEETKIKVNIERGFSPLISLTHEDYTIKWAIPFNIEINEVQKNGIKTLEEYADYYAKRQLNDNMEKALKYHIFKFKKPFFIFIPKGELVSNSGSHRVLDNINLEEEQIFEARLKEFVKFPASMGIFKEDLEELNKNGEKYISLLHYNILFILNEAKRYYWNEVKFYLPCSCDTSGIAELKGEIPFRAIENVIFKGAIIKGNMPFKVIKGNSFIIIHNINEEALKLWIGKNKEIVIPSRKAYYKLYY